jgi:glycerol kinase
MLPEIRDSDSVFGNTDFEELLPRPIPVHAVIKWLAEDVELISSPAEAGALAAGANPLDTTYLVPAFSGPGSPHWASGARACIWGMTRTTDKKETVKAAEESIAYQITDVVRRMKDEGGMAPSELRIDDGGARDACLVQFQSDMLALPVFVSSSGELSGMGAGYAAGMALGLSTTGILPSVFRGNGTSPARMKRGSPSCTGDGSTWYAPLLKAHARPRKPRLRCLGYVFFFYN